MKISVITVVYNAEDTLEQTIMSVYGQSYNEIEYIIIDGSSSDATLSIINKHRDKISHVISEPDQGIYDAMNKGINISTGDVVGFLNADDLYYENNVVEKIIRCFETDSVDACYGDLVYVSKNNLSKIVRYWESCNHIEGLCKTGWMPAHPTLYMRKKIYDKYGTYDLAYKLQSDYELCLRLLEVEKINTKYLPEILVKMRIGGVTNNSIINILKGNLEAYNACKKYFPKTSKIFILRKFMSRLGQFVSRPEQVK